MPKLRPFNLFALAALGGFLLACPARAEILFDGEWDNFGEHFDRKGDALSWMADYAPNRWHTIQARGLDRITPVLDPDSPKHGAVARVDVRPGDNVGWSGERAEVTDMLGGDAESETKKHLVVMPGPAHEFYGIAVKLAPDWKSPGKDHGNGYVWGLFLQLHGPNVFSIPPAIALAAEDDFHLDICSGDVLEGGTRKVHKDSQAYAFTNGSLKRGQWVQFMVDAVWSYGDDGYVAIYRRDAGEKTFAKVLELNHMPTLQSEFGIPEGDDHHYWKAGFYRSTSAGLTNTLWLGPLVRGTTFDEVAQAAFGKP
jgi:hypothetical protein